MKKLKKRRQKIGAILLSFVVAMSMIFAPSTFTQKKVSADTDIEDLNQLEKWSLISRLLDENDRYFTNTPTDKAAAIYTAAEYYWSEEGANTVDVDDFCNNVTNYFAGIEG